MSTYTQLSIFSRSGNGFWRNWANLKMFSFKEIYQKQSPEVFCKKSFFQKFCKIHSKTPVPESFF